MSDQLIYKFIRHNIEFVIVRFVDLKRNVNSVIFETPLYKTWCKSVHFRKKKCPPYWTRHFVFVFVVSETKISHLGNFMEISTIWPYRNRHFGFSRGPHGIRNYVQKYKMRRRFFLGTYN